MRVFLKKIFFFLLPLVVLAASVFLINSRRKTETIVSIRLNPGDSILFAGDSHMALGINDSLIPGAKNVANVSENLYYTYFKLKSILSNNRVTTVYLNIDWHSFNQGYDRIINGDLSAGVGPKYYFSMPWEEQFKMQISNLSNILMFNRRLFERKYTDGFTGGYVNSFTSNKTDSAIIAKRAKYLYYETDQNTVKHLSSYSEKYLYKIVKLCREKRVRLILIQLPTHPYYASLVPREFTGKFNALIANLGLMKIPADCLSDSMFTPDGDHLSIQGANMVSKQFLYLMPATDTK